MRKNPRAGDQDRIILMKTMPVLESSQIKQVHLGEVTRGLAKPIATIRLEPEDISRKFGVKFESTKDDLDELKAALIHSNSGRQFALVRHQHQPNPGTDILTYEHSPNLTDDLLDVLQLLAIRQRDLIWTHPEIETQQIRNTLKNHLASKRKPNPAFMRPVQPDDKLSAIVGSTPLPRSELTKKLWNYIKRHGCQDKKKKTMINADDSLRPVFNGKSQVSMFEMTKLVSKHLR